MGNVLSQIEKTLVRRLSLSQDCRAVNVANALSGRNHRVEAQRPDLNLQGGSFMDCGANVGEPGIWSRHHELTMALWHQRDTLTFPSAPDTADSSLFEIDKAVGRLQVDALPLDEAGVEMSQTGPNILKLEAEGAEPEILDGALKTLPLLHYVALDCGYERGREKRHTFIDVCDRLLPLGFRPIGANLRRVTVLFKNSALV